MTRRSEVTLPAGATRDSAGDGNRVLLVVNGVSKFFTHRGGLALGLRDRGWRVEMVVPEDEDDSVIRSEGIRTHSIPLDRSSVSPVKESRTVLALAQLYEDRDPVLVHHFTPKPVIYGGIAARLAEVPGVVSSIAGLEYPFISDSVQARTLRALAALGYRLALSGEGSRVIFENETDLGVFVERGLTERSISRVIVGAGVDVEQFQPPSEPIGGPTRVLLAARMLRQKGVVEFMEAARRLRAEGSHARFLLAGGSDATNPTSIEDEQLRAWDREDGIDWLGRLAHDRMPAVMRSVDVVCLPSYREGAAKVLLEAAASGRAIVTTDVPGCREAVEPGESGLLVPPRDPDALADALGAVLRDAELRRRMGRRGREIAVERFSIQRVVEKTAEVYRELTAETVLRTPTG